MAPDPYQLRIYAYRLISLICSSESVPETVTRSLLLPLLQCLDSILSPESAQYSLSSSINNLQVAFEALQLFNEWVQMDLVLKLLAECKLQQEVSDYMNFVLYGDAEDTSGSQQQQRRAVQQSQRKSHIEPLKRSLTHILPRIQQRHLVLRERDEFQLKTQLKRLSTRILSSGSMESRMGTTSPLMPFESISRSSPARSISDLNTRPSPFNTGTNSTLNQRLTLQNPPMAELTSRHDTSPILDPEIVRYLQYTLVGIDSNLVIFTNNALEIPHGFSNSHQYFMKDLFELALLFRYLSGYVHNAKQMESPIKRAFLTSVRSYLEEYSYFIEDLFRNNDINLQEVYNACYYPWLFQFRFINALFRKYFDIERYIPGDQLLSKLYSLSKFGDLNLSNLTFLEQSINPYFEVLEHWLLRGELIDHANEFFIRFDESKTNFNEMILFDALRIPRFLTFKVAKRVYHIGKMIIFLSKVCHELEWIDKYISRDSEIVQKNIQGSLQYYDNLESLIDSLYNQLLKKFTSVIHGPQNELVIHILNLKDILLTNRNDLVEQTIRKGSPLLNHVASDISGSYLTRLLNESLSMFFESKFRYLNRVDARLLASDHGSIGWDVFTFDYRLEDLPVHHILNYRDSFREYLKIFNFFWKIKHLQYCLDQMFIKTFRKLNHKVSQSLRIHLRNIAIIRNQMSLFLLFLMSYFSYSIVEELFQKHIVQNLFKSNLGNTSQQILLNRFVKSVRSNSTPTNDLEGNKSLNTLTMDELVEFHSNYLTSITSNKLLSTDHVGSRSKQSFIVTIYDILTTINKFVESGTVFYAVVEEYEHEVLLNLSQMLAQNEHLITRLMSHAIREIHQRGKELYNQIYRKQYASQVHMLYRDLNGDSNLRMCIKMGAFPVLEDWRTKVS